MLMNLVALTGILEARAVFCECYGEYHTSTPPPHTGFRLRHPCHPHCADDWIVEIWDKLKTTFHRSALIHVRSTLQERNLYIHNIHTDVWFPPRSTPTQTPILDSIYIPEQPRYIYESHRPTHHGIYGEAQLQKKHLQRSFITGLSDEHTSSQTAVPLSYHHECWAHPFPLFDEIYWLAARLATRYSALCMGAASA